MRVVVVGVGKVGSTVSEYLAKEGGSLLLALERWEAPFRSTWPKRGMQ